MISKFFKHSSKMTPKHFEKFLVIQKILTWKDEFRFEKNYNESGTSGKPGVPEYWWTHVDGAVSGEAFTTFEECELSALIYFCKTWGEK
jgi:hypothetical protein